MIENLSREEIIARVLRLQKLPEGFEEWFSYARVVHPSKGLIAPTFYPKFKEIVEALVEKHYVIILKSRQCGVSTLLSLFSIYAASLFPGWSAGVISRRREDAVSFLEKGRIAIQYLPLWLRPKISTWNKLSLTFSHASKILTSPPSKDAFRGETLSLLVIDEAAACRRIDEVYTAAYLTLSKNFSSLQEASSSRPKMPFGIVIISTGAVLDNPSAQFFFDMWDRAMMGANNFVPIKIHWSDVGYTPEWKMEQAKALGEDPDKIMTELECGFVIARQDAMVFPPDVLRKIQTQIARADRVPYERWQAQKVGV